MGVVERLAELAAEVAAVRRLVVGLDDRLGAREHLVVRPFLTDLQRLRDDLVRQADAFRTHSPEGHVVELLEALAYSVEQSLARGGVEVVRPDVGSPLDERRHRVTGTVLAASADQDGTVAEVLSDGYVDTTTDRTMRSASVRVYRSPRTGNDVG
jgi:molecular chaperone GrpE (heat shock protein)